MSDSHIAFHAFQLGRDAQTLLRERINYNTGHFDLTDIGVMLLQDHGRHA